MKLIIWIIYIKDSSNLSSPLYHVDHHDDVYVAIDRNDAYYRWGRHSAQSNELNADVASRQPRNQLYGSTSECELIVSKMIKYIEWMVIEW